MLKLDGVVYVEQINDCAFKVYMKVKLTNNFDNDIGGYKLVIKNSELPINGSIEANLSYLIVNNTAISEDDVIGFSQLYIAYPKNGTEIKELNEKQSLMTLYGIPLEFRIWRYHYNILDYDVNYTYIAVYARSSKYVDLMSYIMNSSFFSPIYYEYLQPIYKRRTISK